MGCGCNACGTKNMGAPGPMGQAAPTKLARSSRRYGGAPGPMGFLSWFESDPTDDRSVGLRVLQAYYDRAKSYPGFMYSSFSAFLTAMERATPLATDIGELIRQTYRTNSESTAISRVKDLAVKSQGMAQAGSLIQAAGGAGNSINWSVAVSEVTPQIVGDTFEYAGEVLQDVGTGVMGTLSLVKYLPYILLGGGALYIALNSDKVKSRVKKEIKDRAASL